MPDRRSPHWLHTVAAAIIISVFGGCVVGTMLFYMNRTATWFEQMDSRQDRIEQEIAKDDRVQTNALRELDVLQKEVAGLRKRVRALEIVSADSRKRLGTIKLIPQED